MPASTAQHLFVSRHGGGHGDDGRLPFRTDLNPDTAGRFHPVHLRHVHVHQHEVVRHRVDRCHGLDAVPGDVSPVSEPPQQEEHDLAGDRVVLDEQDVRTGRLPRRSQHLPRSAGRAVGPGRRHARGAHPVSEAAAIVSVNGTSSSSAETKPLRLIFPHDFFPLM